jgi:hypothetical protein
VLLLEKAENPTQCERRQAGSEKNRAQQHDTALVEIRFPEPEGQNEQAAEGTKRS